MEQAIQTVYLYKSSVTGVVTPVLHTSLLTKVIHESEVATRTTSVLMSAITGHVGYFPYGFAEDRVYGFLGSDGVVYVLGFDRRYS